MDCEAPFHTILRWCLFSTCFWLRSAVCSAARMYVCMYVQCVCECDPALHTHRSCLFIPGDAVPWPLPPTRVLTHLTHCLSVSVTPFSGRVKRFGVLCQFYLFIYLFVPMCVGCTAIVFMTPHPLTRQCSLALIQLLRRLLQPLNSETDGILCQCSAEFHMFS